MTPKQDRLYWSLVRAAVAAHCEENGIEKLSAKDASALRHRWHVESLGADKSHTEFSNADFDKVKAHLLALAKPDDFTAAMFEQSAADRGERKRLLFRIGKFETGYVNRICWDKFHCAYADELTTEQLHQLAMTLVERSRAKQRARVAEYAPLPGGDQGVGFGPRVSPNDPRIDALINLLRGRGWVLRAVLVAELSWPDRALRELKSESGGLIISSSQLGYRLTMEATIPEIDHAINEVRSRAKELTQYAIDIEKVFHSRGHS